MRVIVPVLDKLTIQGDSVVNVFRVQSRRLPSVLGQERTMSGEREAPLLVCLSHKGTGRTKK